MKALLLLGALCTMSAMAVTALSPAGAYEINRSSRLNRTYGVGTQLFNATQFGAKATYDFSVLGGASGDLTLLDHEGLPFKLPTNAVIRDCMMDVVLPITGGASTSVALAFSLSEVGDVKALAFNQVAGYNRFQRIACIPAATAATSFKLQSEALLKMRIGSEAVTGGKINIWIEYMISD